MNTSKNLHFALFHSVIFSYVSKMVATVSGITCRHNSSKGNMRRIGTRPLSDVSFRDEKHFLGHPSWLPLIPMSQEWVIYPYLKYSWAKRMRPPWWLRPIISLLQKHKASVESEQNQSFLNRGKEWGMNEVDNPVASAIPLWLFTCQTHSSPK